MNSYNVLCSFSLSLAFCASQHKFSVALPGFLSPLLIATTPHLQPVMIFISGQLSQPWVSALFNNPAKSNELTFIQWKSSPGEALLCCQIRSLHFNRDSKNSFQFSRHRVTLTLTWQWQSLLRAHPASTGISNKVILDSGLTFHLPADYYGNKLHLQKSISLQNKKSNRQSPSIVALQPGHFPAPVKFTVLC